MIKRYLVLLYLKCRELNWHFWSVVLRFKLNQSVVSGIPYNRILILAPHSDDEWIGCSSIIRDNKDVTVCNMNKPGGDTGELHIEREMEMKKICQMYKKKYFSLGNNDSNALIDVISALKPEVILLPFFYDWHPEHQEVINTLEKVIREKENVLNGVVIGMYQVSVPIRQSAISHCMKMSKKEYLEKWKVFCDIYATQKHISYKRFAAYERINGALCNSYSSEVFAFMDIRIWIEQKSHLCPNPKEIDILKSNIDNIRSVFSLVNKK